MCYIKARPLIFIAIMLGVYCQMSIREYKFEDIELNYKLYKITQEIDVFGIDKIYLIDLYSEAYGSLEFSGESISENKGHIDIFFLTNKRGMRLAEIKASPLEEKITIKYQCDNYNMVLYDSNTREYFFLSESNASKKWLDYEINIDQFNECVEIKRVN